MKRFKIYNIINSDNITLLGKLYDIFMIIIIMLSLLPLVFKEQTAFLISLDKITVSIFIIDYILRWSTADFKYDEKSIKSFLRYPFSAMAIIDLLSILPSLNIIGSAFKALRLTRLFRAFRVFRVFRIIRYSKAINLLFVVIKKSKYSLCVVGGLAVVYILTSALIIFNTEPESFNTYYDAVYWATVSLTTVGYGDLYPITTVGRTIAMLSSFLGIAIVALPAGIITAGYVQAINEKEK